MQWQKSELSYCSNVHPGADLDTVSHNVKSFIGPIAQKRQLDSMAAGLWLAQKTCSTLYEDEKKRDDFFHLLASQHLYIGTLNGFPYGDFHQSIVKHTVYQPTWAQKERLDYTVKLATLLARAPTGPLNSLSISTLSLAYAANWNEELQQEACRNLCSLVLALEKIEHNKGKLIRVCLEMEPDCVIETTDQLITFFKEDLTKTARKLQIPLELVYRYLGCCYDTCHQAVMHESLYESLVAITDADIHIGKIQVSNAPRTVVRTMDELATLCHTFNEPKFLHQVKVKANNKITAFSDLDFDAISNTTNIQALFGHPWHIHFHVPIHLSTFDHSTIGTTQTDINDVFRFLEQQELVSKPFLEIETYTWAQFSPGPTHQLTDNINAEIDWLEDQLHRHHLLDRTT